MEGLFCGVLEAIFPARRAFQLHRGTEVPLTLSLEQKRNVFLGSALTKCRGSELWPGRQGCRAAAQHQGRALRGCGEWR